MFNTKINITPLSVNKAWQGKRFKTPAYKKYEKIVLLMLPKQDVGFPFYKLTLEFGFSSPLSDIDNPLKPIIDIIQKKYNINDKDIVSLNVSKKLVKKGQEFINISIESNTQVLF